MALGVTRESPGGRGSRSDSPAVRRAADRPEPEPILAIAEMTAPARSGPSLGTLAGLAAGALLAGSLLGSFRADHGISVGLLELLVVAAAVVLLIVRRRFQVAHAQAPPVPRRGSDSVAAPAHPATTEDHSSGASSLDQGIRDIRRTDPGFDPTRFAGYTCMVFRDAQAAWTARDVDAVRDRITPEMYSELYAQCLRLRETGQADRVARIEITSEITEAWQESGRDYATAHIEGSIVDYRVHEATDSLVHGSRTVPKDIEQFWTFTRSGGLNFWMLSAVRTA